VKSGGNGVTNIEGKWGENGAKIERKWDNWAKWDKHGEKITAAAVKFVFFIILVSSYSSKHISMRSPITATKNTATSAHKSLNLRNAAR